MHRFGLLLLVFIFSSFSGRQDALSLWPADVVKRADTARKVSFLSDEEKDIVLYTNLARMDGPLFERTLLKDLDESYSAPYIGSLKRDLKKSKKMDPLHFSRSLYNNAVFHAEKQGKKGTYGHEGYSQRFKKFAPHFGVTAENCDYGNARGLEVVLSLLVDDGVSGVGHRKNILNPSMDSIGVAIRPHKKDEVLAVQCFGGK